MKTFLLFLIAGICGHAALCQASVQVDLRQQGAPLRPIWAWYGYDEPNYTYMKDGRKLLTELAALSPVPVYVRTHSLLVSGDGKPALKWGSTNAYSEDAAGNPIYNWRIVDSIFDAYIQRGMKPLAQIGFMPEALSSSPQPYRHHWKPGDPYNNIYTGWAYPPKDYNKWRELVYQWVQHCVNRYGRKEVESWYWEVWNEPDIGYWKGTQQEFFKLYDYAVDGVKKALPTARVGGPDATGGATKWLEAFIRHCLYETNYATGRQGTPLDLIAFHAKGAPRLSEGKVVMGIRNQLRNIDNNFKLIASFPELKGIPVIIGESDPEGCAACGMATNPENAYRNGTLYASYTAASFARKYELAAQHNINLLGAVTWAFEFEDQPWFYGFRDLATNGINKPVLQVFRMLGMMEGKMLPATATRMYPLQTILDSGIRQQTDIGALAAGNNRSATILLWNYHDEDRIDSAAAIALQVSGIPVTNVQVQSWVVDRDHNNSYEVWKSMGSPQQPTPAQIKKLEAAGQLQPAGKMVYKRSQQGKLTLPLRLLRQGVMLVQLTW